MAGTPKLTRKSAAAARAWQLLFDFFVATRPERDRTLESRNLTANDSRALMTLDAGAGKTMGTLAAEWSCDASNATWIVDRLERLGFAKRRPSPRDRRAKLVVLTPAGAKAKAEILAEFRTPPAAFLELTAAELDALTATLEKLRPPALRHEETGGDEPQQRRKSRRRK
jgi:DNA-binding MarR family transcriptional regulator